MVRQPVSSSARRDRKSAVNQRSRTPSATASTPPASIAAMRASQLASSPILAAVSERTRRGEQVRALPVELLGDQAADRQADDRRALDAERVEEAGEVAGVVGHVDAVGAGFAEAVAALVVADDPEVARETRRDLVPDARSLPSALMRAIARPSRGPSSR